MPTAYWVAWKRILSCKQDSHVAVYDPKAANTSSNLPPPLPPPKAPYRSSPHPIKNHPNFAKKRSSPSSSVCCNDLKNVVHGNTRVMHRADHDSPLSHHAPHQLKVLLQEPSILPYSPRISAQGFYVERSSAYHAKRTSTTSSASCYDCSIAACEPPDPLISPKSSIGFQAKSENGNLYTPSICQKCGERVSDAPDSLEEHYATHHAVTELKEGDSARSIVEIIFQTCWFRQDSVSARPERIFKVHNSPKTIAKFEDYREMVKMKASKISKKHSRCLVDGNELLRFYGTTVACRMGKMRTSTSSSSLPWTTSLCPSPLCGVCQILKHGFPTKGQPGIYTNASSGQAHNAFMFSKDYDDARTNPKRAMLVCRVVAGRVKKSGYESSQDGPISGYDSVAGEAGLYTDLEELLVFNNKAVLPCFVVVYGC